MPPAGFWLDDNRWGMIWQTFEEKARTLTLVDLREIFPAEDVLREENLK